MKDRKWGGRLPDDEAYWDDLASRVIARAFRSHTTEVAATRGVSGSAPWWTRLADASVRLAAAAVLALLGGTLLLGEGPSPAAAPDALMTRMSPEEPMLRTLILDPTAPPPASALVNLMALREEGR